MPVGRKFPPPKLESHLAQPDFMQTTPKDLPKILFVNDYSPDSLALGDLFRQLLLGYPVEKLAWWHCRRTPVYDQPDLKAGTVYHFNLPRKLAPIQRWTLSKCFIL